MLSVLHASFAMPNHDNFKNEGKITMSWQCITFYYVICLGKPFLLTDHISDQDS